MQRVVGAAGRLSTVTTSFKLLVAPLFGSTKSHLVRLEREKYSINIYNDQSVNKGKHKGQEVGTNRKAFRGAVKPAELRRKDFARGLVPIT